MLTKKTRIRIRKFHRVLAAILGIQILFWIVGGIYFSWIPMDKVRGRDLGKFHGQKPDPIDLSLIKGISDLAIPPHLAVQKVGLAHHPKVGLIYTIETNEGEYIVDAVTGRKRDLLTSEQIMEIAKADYKENFNIVSVKLIEKDPPAEYSASLPVYQVQFDDQRSTRLYFHPLSGELRGRRNHYWRIFDFLWRLHILDFGGGENTNNYNLKFLSLMSLGVVFTGYVLFFSTNQLLKRRRKPEAFK